MERSQIRLVLTLLLLSCNASYIRAQVSEENVGPRDALAPTPAEGPSLLRAANNHRVLRRGRKYSSKIENEREDDGQERGLARGSHPGGAVG